MTMLLACRNNFTSRISVPRFSDKRWLSRPKCRLQQAGTAPQCHVGPAAPRLWGPFGLERCAITRVEMHRVRGAHVTGNGSTSDSVTAASEVLTAEFGCECQQLLRYAISLAANQAHTLPSPYWQAFSTDDNYHRQDNAAAGVTVTKQHLMLAVLQQQPEAFHVLGQYMAADRGAAAHSTRQAIASKLSTAYSSTPAGTDAQLSDARLSAVQLSDGLLDALGCALHITRRLGLPEVSGLALLWGLMAAPDAPCAFEHLLGVKLYSRDLADQLELLMVLKNAVQASFPSTTGAAKAELSAAVGIKPGSLHPPADANTAGDSNSAASTATAVTSPASSMVDMMLQLMLSKATAQLQAHEKDAALRTLTAALLSAADMRFRPSNGWMQNAWEAVNAALTRTSLPLFGRLVEPGPAQDVRAAVIRAACASATVLQYTGPSLCSAFGKVEPPDIPSSGAVATEEMQAWLQWIAACKLLGVISMTDMLALQLPTNIFRHGVREVKAVYAAIDTADATVLARASPFLVTAAAQAGWYSNTLAEKISCKLTQLTSAGEASGAIVAWDALDACADISSSAQQQHAAASWVNAAEHLTEHCNSSSTNALGISTGRLAALYTKLASTDATKHIPAKCGLLELLLQRLHHQPLPHVVKLAEAALAKSNMAQLSAVQLAEVVTAAAPAVSAMSVQQLDLYLSVLVALQQCKKAHHAEDARFGQLMSTALTAADTTSSPSPSTSSTSSSSSTDNLPERENELLQKLHTLLTEQLPAMVLPTVLAALAAAPKGTGHIAPEPAAAVASILRSMKELKVTVPVGSADAVWQLSQLLPKLGPALKPCEQAAVLVFLGQQQMRHGNRISSSLAKTTPQPVTTQDTAATEAATSVAGHPSGINSTTSGNPGASSPLPEDPAAAADVMASVTDHGEDPASTLTVKSSQGADVVCEVFEVLSVDSTSSCHIPSTAAALCDVAQALGSSKLPVEPAVMDVLAGHVGTCMNLFSSKQLAVLMWAFACKHPTAAAAGVMAELATSAQVAAFAGLDGDMLDATERAVCNWARNQLCKADLLTVYV